MNNELVNQSLVDEIALIDSISDEMLFGTLPTDYELWHFFVRYSLSSLVDSS